MDAMDNIMNSLHTLGLHTLFVYYRITLASVVTVSLMFVAFESVWFQDKLDYRGEFSIEDIARHNIKNSTKDEFVLQDILSYTSDKIFFVESSGLRSFKGRNLCAFESAAKHHPNTSIYIAMTVDAIPRDSDVLVLHQKYPNINIRKLNVDKFLRGEFLFQVYDK